MTYDFLLELDEKTNIIELEQKMSTNRLRRAIESLFALACQYVKGESMENSYDGLHYDGVNGNKFNGTAIYKISFDRQEYSMKKDKKLRIACDNEELCKQAKWLLPYQQGETYDSIFLQSEKCTNVQKALDEICQMVREGKAVHTFGDSHSIITHKVPICRENWLGFNTSYPLTMYRMGKEGLDLHECILVMGNGHQLYPVRQNEYVMYSYGEIDTRFHIADKVPSGPTWKVDVFDHIYNLVVKYVARIKQNEQRFRCKSLVYDILPTCDIEPLKEPRRGTQEQHQYIVQIMREVLKEQCQLANIPMVSLHDTVKGDVKKFFKDGGDVHLRDDFAYLVRDRIMEAICETV